MYASVVWRDSDIPVDMVSLAGSRMSLSGSQELLDTLTGTDCNLAEETIFDGQVSSDLKQRSRRTVQSKALLLFAHRQNERCSLVKQI